MAVAAPTFMVSCASLESLTELSGAEQMTSAGTEIGVAARREQGMRTGTTCPPLNPRIGPSHHHQHAAFRINNQPCSPAA